MPIPGPSATTLQVGLVGRFNKEHPEYRIPGSTHLDFRHAEVRQSKIDVIMELAERGVDAVLLDFTVYPPHFEQPDRECMTGFMRKVRRGVDAVGERLNRAIAVIAELPYRGAWELGLDWQRWMEERLIDVIVPTRMRGGETFDVRVEEFIRTARRTGVKVWGFIWFALGFVSTDPMPLDEQAGVRRYSKPKTKGMFFAQAHLFHSAGVDGLEIASSKGTEWTERPWYNDLADPDIVRYADKHYTADPVPFVPLRFELSGSSPFVTERAVCLRIADDIRAAERAGYRVDARLIVYSRGLAVGECLVFRINDAAAVVRLGGSAEERALSDPVDWRRDKPVWTDRADDSFIADPTWWQRGERVLEIDPHWLHPGDNVIRIVYGSETGNHPPFETSWIDLILEYHR